jgi:hypothetical protein
VLSEVLIYGRGFGAIPLPFEINICGGHNKICSGRKWNASFLSNFISRLFTFSGAKDMRVIPEI